jgi:glycosyltransferase involved in cell wall biosynthesis
VDDGSADDTAAVARAHAAAASGRLRAIRLDRNAGKGAAMREGAEATEADVLVFFDADLIGLTPAHVEALLAPVVRGQAVMALGVFRHGRGPTDLAQILVPNISGQRAIRRDVFLAIPCLTRSGFGVELAITNYIADADLPMTRVVLAGVTHPMKEEKLGLVKGASARLRMYRQMLPYMIRGRRRRRPGSGRR